MPARKPRSRRKPPTQSAESLRGAIDALNDISVHVVATGDWTASHQALLKHYARQLRSTQVDSWALVEELRSALEEAERHVSNAAYGASLNDASHLTAIFEQARIAHHLCAAALARIKAAEKNRP